MKHTLLSLLIVGLCTGLGTTAIAQNVTAGDQPDAATPKQNAPAGDAAKDKAGMNTDEKTAPQAESATDKPGMSADEAQPAKTDAEAAATWKAQYAAAQDKAKSVYKDAKTKCDTLQGNAKGDCMTKATAARTEALALAKSQWDSHIKMDGRPARPTKGDLGSAAAAA